MNTIAEKRKALGLSQVQLAEKLGVSQKAVSTYESGLRAPDAATAAKLAEIFGEPVSKTDTAPAPTLLHIPPEEIADNDANFYAVAGVDELAASIELNGLLEPVVVCGAESGSMYRLVSGHRRLKAWKQLQAEQPEKYAAIPAILVRPESRIREELMLIEANSTGRVLTSFEVMKQAEKYQDLLAQGKAAGMSFPGRMRDRVADAMQVSASKLARLDMIRKNLIEDYMAEFESGALNESTAYTLAQVSTEDQLKLARLCGPMGKWAEWQVKAKLFILTDIRERKCPHELECPQPDYYYIGTSVQCEANKNGNVGKVCCNVCWRADNCPVACAKCRELAEEGARLAEERQAANVERAKAEAEARTEKQKALDEVNDKSFRRCHDALNSITREEFNAVSQLPGISSYTFDEEDWREATTAEHGDFDFDYDDLLALSGATGLRFEYLCGLTDDPGTAPASASAAGLAGPGFDALGDPPETDDEVLVFIPGDEIKSDRWEIDRWRRGEWYFSNGDNVTRWWPLPDKPATVKEEAAYEAES